MSNSTLKESLSVKSLLLKKELMKKDCWFRTFARLESKLDKGSGELAYIQSLVDSEEYEYYVNLLITGEYQWSIPSKVEIAKVGTSKKRVVYMYPAIDRFFLGLLYRGMSEMFKGSLADNCFSYRRGVSTNTAIKYIDKMKKQTKMYGLKLDISAYFNSVSKSHLEKCLDELFTTGVDSIRSTLDNVLMVDRVEFKGEIIEEYKSLIPGCALGSFFANYCLRELDFYFMNKGIIYARYSDDIIILAETEERIDEYLDYISNYLGAIGLKINPSKYVHFDPEDAIDYLGLSLSDKGTDISEHSKKKMKRTIKRWVKQGRKEIEQGASFEKVASKLVKRLNHKLYKSYLFDKTKFGWGIYAFRYITVTDSLTELDFYLRDMIRHLKTGKHNKANIKAVSEDDFRRLGVVSFYDMYRLFKEDFDYYVEIAYLI